MWRWTVPEGWHESVRVYVHVCVGAHACSDVGSVPDWPTS